MLEELKALFFELGKKINSWSEKEILIAQEEWGNCTAEEIVSLAARNDLVPILEEFVKNGGDLHFIIDEGGEKANLLNIAAEEDSLNIINYLLDNNIFTVNTEASEGTHTAFYSAVEGNNIEAAKLLLKKGANINAEYLRHNISYSTVKKLFVIYKDENGVEFDHLEMAKLLVRFGVQIPDNIDILCDDSLIQHHPTKGPIKNLLLSIKELENLQGDDCINAYKTSTPEVQEIWDARVSRYHLNKLAEFIEKKFSKESTIENTEYAALREYSSLSKHKQEVLEILLARKNFNSDDFVKVDNHIKDHFFEIACTVKDLTGTVFAAIAKAGIISEVTQYLHFEDSSIKIAGMSLDNNTAGDYS